MRICRQSAVLCSYLTISCTEVKQIFFKTKKFWKKQLISPGYNGIIGSGKSKQGRSDRQKPEVRHSKERSGVGLSGTIFRIRRGSSKIRNDPARLPRPLAGPRNDKTGSFDPKSQHSCDEKTSPPASAGAEDRKMGKLGLRPVQKRTGQAECGRTGQLSAMQTRRKTKRAAVPGKRRSIGRTCDETRARPGMPRREAGKL